MRSRLTAIVIGLGLTLVSAAPSFACAFHDQASAATQQQTAQAQPSQTSPTSTQ